MAVAIAIVDPIREFWSQDDGWAYARMVEHLLATGRYRLDAWTAANMPVQIHLAAGAATVFGYSFSLLRILTLVLLAAGVASFYALLRELRTDRFAAAALALGLLASPLVLLLGFTFMSDVQFLGWLLAALWLYVRSLHRRSLVTALLASAAAAAAIGTRQFGIAIVAGVALAWIASPRATRPSRAWLLVALALPFASGLLQIAVGLQQPNYTQVERLAEQSWFLDRPTLQLALEVVWRIAVSDQYLGILLLPVLPLLLASAWRSWRSFEGAGRRRLALASMLVATAILLAVLWLGSPLSSRTAGMPASTILPLPWLLPTVLWESRRYMIGSALGGIVAGLAFLALSVRQAAPMGRPRPEAATWLLGGTGVALFVLHLGYVQLNDTYLIGFVPFALLIVAAAVRRHGASAAAVAGTVAASFATIVLVSIWMRGDYNLQEAQWLAAEQRLAATGMPSRCIGGGRHWSEYHGAFDDWLAQGRPKAETPDRPRAVAPAERLHDAFYRWLQHRSESGSHLVLAPQHDVPSGWRVEAVIEYRDRLFRRKSFRTVVPIDPAWVSDPACR